jgi:cytochrome P450
MGNDVVSKGNRSLLLPYGPQYRRHQRIQGGMLTLRLSQQYTSLQDLESKQLMYELLSTNEDAWMDRFHRYSSSLIFALAYGKRMPRGDEKEVQNIEQVMVNFLYSARVGTWIVDAIPALNKLPKFLAPWKRIGDEYHEFESKFYLENLEDGRKANGWNWIKQASTMKESSEMSTKELSYVVGIMYEAGSDTTTMAMQSFVLAALTYPDAVKGAQKQLDDIMGDTFPTFEDRARLPIVEALAKETLRWRPVSAGGIPHAVTQDDEYMGYLVPKGATILANHWAIDLDEEVYGADALDFRPYRWIENSDLPLASFGYGRRVCTGQHVAMNSLFINIARLLWTFNIEHAVDESGKKIEADPLGYTQGFNSGPLPFKARFVVRSEERRAAVEKAWASAEKDAGVLLDDIERATSKGS